MISVHLKFTGLVRSRMGLDRMDYEFEGYTLGELLVALFNSHDIQDLLMDDNGTILPYSRVVINGRFSYLVGDMEAQIQEGDTIVLIRPYVVAF
jgi:molybdopterin converting factor small subunit